MGLFGGGNSSTSTNTSTNNIASTNTPQASLGGIAPNNNQIVINPQLGSTVGSVSSTSSSSYNYSPSSITDSINYGDSAIAAGLQTALASITASQAANASSLSTISNVATSAGNPAPSSGLAGSAIVSGGTGSSGFSLSSLLSAPDIYYLIGGLVLLMLLRGHHRA